MLRNLTDRILISLKRRKKYFVIIIPIIMCIATIPINNNLIPIIKKKYNIPNYYYEHDMSYDGVGYTTAHNFKKLETAHKVYTSIILWIVLYVLEFGIYYFCICILYKSVLLR